jgi:hypothetical protein
MRVAENCSIYQDKNGEESREFKRFSATPALKVPRLRRAQGATVLHFQKESFIASYIFCASGLHLYK